MKSRSKKIWPQKPPSQLRQVRQVTRSSLQDMPFLSPPGRPRGRRSGWTSGGSKPRETPKSPRTNIEKRKPKWSNMIRKMWSLVGLNMFKHSFSVLRTEDNPVFHEDSRYYSGSMAARWFYTKTYWSQQILNIDPAMTIWHFNDRPKQETKENGKWTSTLQKRAKDISQPGAFCALKPLWSKVLDPIIPEQSGHGNHGTETQDAKFPAEASETLCWWGAGDPRY